MYVINDIHSNINFKMTRKYQKMQVFFEESASTMVIDLNTMIVENWAFGRTMSTNYKTADNCCLNFEASDGEMHFYQGYVPDFFPNKHYGDYIMLDIKANGHIPKLKVTDEQIDEALKEYEDNFFEIEEGGE
jgi:hypothetical protein